jgi:glycosyltransferase involved in cell wall biosynthesis
VWVTLHDAPSVCGGAFFFQILDRPGGRRLAERLSRTIGRRAERSLLKDAERVYCLSEAGARIVTSEFDLRRPVERLPHVAAANSTPVDHRRSIFFPGYVDGVENIKPVLRALDRTPSDWHFEIGACGERTTNDTKRAARELGIEMRVRVLGYLGEEQLNEAFERAAIVVRWRSAGWAKRGSPGSEAVSGPLIRAMAHGAAILTNDSRGISECLSDAGALQLPAGNGGAEVLEEAIVALVQDAVGRAAMATAARRHILREHDPSHILRLLVGA